MESKKHSKLVNATIKKQTHRYRDKPVGEREYRGGGEGATHY